jgi:decaprenylphospho-beta-D-erythro-pentofuranosid-2-ulose 2-reductase
VVSSGEPQRVLVLGGSSEIGVAILRRLAERRPLRAVLLGRDADRMRDAAKELADTGGSIAEVDHLNAEDLATC